jgi:hypothetical protein
MRVRTLLLTAATLLALPACRPPVDLSRDLQVEVVSSGWYDAGIDKGMNKLVPSISFTLKNTSDQTLVMLEINAIFRRVTNKDEGELGRGFVIAAGPSGLAPGVSSRVFTVRSEFGYLGTEPRLQILQNTQFIDGKVALSGKYGSLGWEPLGEYPIMRRLITR